MATIRPGSPMAISKSLGRVQACVDQMVGVQECLKAGVNIAPTGLHAEHTLRVLALLQEELDNVYALSGRRSASAEADGSEWILRKLRP
jgi:hypothetical protein